MTSAPIITHESEVEEAWVDTYGHMNMANYLRVCDEGTYAFWEHVNEGMGLDERRGAEYAVVEAHVNYLQEVRLGDPLRVTTQLLDADRKRFRLFHTLTHTRQGFVSATNEVMALGFDLNARALMPFTGAAHARLQALLKEHRELPVPENAGRGIGAPRRKSPRP